MEDIIEECTESTLPTKYYGEFKIKAFKTKDNQHHIALIKGNVKGKKNVLVRVHSECMTGDLFHSLKCDCGVQLETALRKISKGSGVLLYLRQEGRGIGLYNKIKAYHLQDNGMDTVEANEKLGFKADQRDYTVGAAILKNLGLSTIRLMTNNPRKINGLEEYGIRITERIPLIVGTNKYNKRYLETKKAKLGHLIDKSGFIRRNIYKVRKK